MGESQQRASAAEAPGWQAPSLGMRSSTATVPAAWQRWAEAWRRWARATQLFRNWASVSSVTAGPRASTPDGRGQADQRACVLCRSTGYGGGAGSGQELLPEWTPLPPTRPGPRSQPLQHTGTCCPCRRILMGPEGVSADRQSWLLQQGQLPTSRLLLDPAVSHTQTQASPARPLR